MKVFTMSPNISCEPPRSLQIDDVDGNRSLLVYYESFKQKTFYHLKSSSWPYRPAYAEAAAESFEMYATN